MMQNKLKALIPRLAQQRTPLLQQIRTWCIVMISITFCGCATKVARVPIPIKVQSEIDIGTYSNFAVLPFVNKKSSTKSDEIAVEIGPEIAQILRSNLTRQKHFQVADEKETARLMTGEEIGEEWLANTERLSELGQYFEVKGIIVGSYRFETDTRPRRYYGERYSTYQQRYVMDYQDYMQKTYLLSLRVLIIDVDEEKNNLGRSISAKYSTSAQSRFFCLFADVTTRKYTKRT